VQSLIYIIYAVLEYLLVTAFLLRLILPLARANMRNAVAQAVLRVTSPVVLPLRRVLPPIGRVDTASAAALLIVQFLTVWIVLTMGSVWLYPNISINFTVLAYETLLELTRQLLRVYSFALLIYAVLSWLAPQTYSPGNELLGSLCDPILRRVRRIIPPLGGLDLSIFFVFILITALLIAVPRSPFPFN
jgi:YggT family protein